MDVTFNILIKQFLFSKYDLVVKLRTTPKMSTFDTAAPIAGPVCYSIIIKIKNGTVEIYCDSIGVLITNEHSVVFVYLSGRAYS